MANTTTTVVLTASDKTRPAFDSIKRSMEGLSVNARKLNSIFGTLVGAAGLGALAAGLGALAGGLGAGAFAGLVKSSADALDALNDVADATGASIENISALEDTARRTGASLETVETSLVKMNQALNTASDPNSTAAGALRAIGLSAEELKKQDPAEALLNIAKALDGYADDGNKARLVQELFGKSLKEVAPLLKDLAEQGKLNATVTAEQAAEAEKFNKQLFGLQTNLENVGRTIANAVLPVLNDATFQMSEQSKQAGLLKGALAGIGEVAGPVRTVFETIAVLGVNVAYVFEQIGIEIGGMAAQIAALGRLDFKGFANIGRMMKEDAAKARADVDAFSATLLDRTRVKDSREGSRDLVGPPESLRTKPSAKFNPYTPPKPPKGPKAAKEYDAELEMSRRAADAYAKALESISNAQQAANDSTLTLTPSQKALRDLMADPVWQDMPETWKQVAIAQTEAAVSAEKAAEEQKRLNDLLSATPTAQLEKQRETMQFLADAFERGAISAEQFSEATMAALGQLPEASKEAADAMDQFMVQAARNIQDAFADFLFDPFKDGLEGMLANFGKVIQRMVAQAVAADLGKRLFGEDLASGKSGAQLGGWAKTALDWLGGLFKSADGNAFTASGPVSAFASGGAFGNGAVLNEPTYFRFASGGAWRMGVAGEAGAEAAMPLKRMSNGKLGVYSAGSGGPPIVINQSFPPGTPAETRAAAAHGARQAMAAFERARRYG